MGRSDRKAVEQVTIAHISDLHLARSLVDPPSESPRFPHRYGHSPAVFFALDRKLRDLAWDILVLSGDVSRVGENDSFNWARNWLDGKLLFGQTEIGLELASSQRQYVVVPGNHDRFNDRFKQDELTNYIKQFPAVTPGKVESLRVRNSITVNCHLYDTSYRGGSFGYGRLSDDQLSAKRMRPDEIDIAVLHHHVMQPTTQERERATELVNSREVFCYLLNCEFDAIFYGHTHNYYFDVLPPRMLCEVGGLRRERRGFFKSLVPRLLLRAFNDQPDGITYERERTTDGRFPTTRSYFEYLYLKHVLKRPVLGPSSFRTPAAFYKHLRDFDAGIDQKLRDLKRRRIAISMAPSACQDEAPRHGFHLVTFFLSDARAIVKIRWELYVYKGSEFELHRAKTFAGNA